MSFEFERKESVSRGVRRIAEEQVGLLLADLHGKKRIGRDAVVHEARKRLNRLRALLRLVHGSMDRKTRRHLNDVLRDLGRTFSDARDAKVLIDAFDRVLKRGTDKSLPVRLRPIRGRLIANHRKALQAQMELGWDDAVKSLRTAKRKISSVSVDGEGFAALHEGLKRIFRAGRKAFARSRDDRDAGIRHEWRKRVKDLRYHAELLKPVCPDVLKQFEGRAHALANCLGEEHDLYVLREHLLHEISRLAVPADLESLFESIDDRHRELRNEAIRLGERVYSEKPGDFIERMQNAWNAWSNGVADT